MLLFTVAQYAVNLWLLCYAISAPFARWRLRKIPGPYGLPLVGNLGTMMRLGRDASMMRWSRIYGSVFKVWLGARPIVVCTSADGCRTITTRNTSSFPHRWRPADSIASPALKLQQRLGLLFAKGDYHRSVRHALLPLMHSETLAALSPAMLKGSAQLVSLLCDAASAGASVDVHKLFGEMTMDVISDVICGHGVGAQRPLGAPPSELVRSAESVFAHFEPLNGSGRVNDAWAVAMMVLPSALHPLLRAAATRWPSRGVVALEAADARVRQKSTTILREYKASAPAAAAPPRLVAMLSNATLKYGGGQPLSDIEILAQMQTVLLAGYETTSSALAHAVYFLAQDGDATRRLCAEVDALARLCGGREPTSDDATRHLPFATACINEALRLKPPASVLVRECVSATRVDGFLIPAGTTVMMCSTPIHLDQAHWPEPLTFRPERFLDGSDKARHPMAFLPFGAGPRSCIGGRLAMAEAVLALARIYQSVTLALEPGQVPLANREGLTNVPAHGVHVRVLKR